MFLFNTASNWLIGIAFCVLSYLIGSIPFSLVIGKSITKRDLREFGSGNIGSTNAIRTYGKKIGYLIFFFEVLKGALVILLVKYLFDGLIFNNPVPLIFYGLSAVLGHLFPIYIKFKGGKVVATSLGVLFAICPAAALVCLIIFGITFFTSGYVSLSSCLAAISAVVTIWIQFAVGFETSNPGLQYLFGKLELVTPLVATIMLTIILIRHIPNFKRLANGTESNFKKKKNNIEK